MKKHLIEFQQSFYKKFLGFLIKKGYKNKAKRLLDISFLTLIQIFKIPFSYFFFNIFKILNIYIEIKTVHSRKRSYVIPFPIKSKRRSYLIIKWLIKSIRCNKKKESMSYKIISEISYILNKKIYNLKNKNVNSRALTFKKLNISQALANRSNMHYRW